MLSSLKAFPFKRFLISLLISSTKIIGLILNTLCFIIVSILLKFIILVLRKNLIVKILIFIVLLSIKASLVDFLRFNKWGSAFTIFAFLFHFNKI